MGFITAILGDEEDEGEFGTGFPVAEHPETFQNVAYAVSEIGGFTMHIAGKNVTSAGYHCANLIHAADAIVSAMTKALTN